MLKRFDCDPIQSNRFLIHDFSIRLFKTKFLLKRLQRQLLQRQLRDCSMIDLSRREAALFASIATIAFIAATPAFSQVTDAQRSAVRAQCRSDYEAHCADVPPGGAASLQCLQKNMSSLAPGCQSAVRAVQ